LCGRIIRGAFERTPCCGRLLSGCGWRDLVCPSAASPNPTTAASVTAAASRKPSFRLFLRLVILAAQPFTPPPGERSRIPTSPSDPAPYIVPPPPDLPS